jgi:hypothetical protein
MKQTCDPFTSINEIQPRLAVQSLFMITPPMQSQVTVVVLNTKLFEISQAVQKILFE